MLGLAVDTRRLGDIEVQDASGAPVRFATAWQDGPALLVFLRHFG